MATSNRLRELKLTGQGVHLLDVDVRQARILTGSVRFAQELREHVAAHNRQMELERRDLEARCQTLEAKLATQVAPLRLEQQDLKLLSSQTNTIAQPVPRAATKKPRRHKTSAPTEASIGTRENL
jgi:hypothetical protein